MGKNLIKHTAIIFLLACLGCLAACGERAEKKKEQDELPALLTNNNKDSVRQLLLNDETKDVDAELKRITLLQQKVLDRYGFEGLKLILEKEDSAVYELGKFPAQCPWAALNKLSPAQLIDSNFYSLRADLPDMIRVMKERCRIVFTEKTDSGWLLNYVLDMVNSDGVRHFTVYAGGSPNKNVPNYLPYKWTIPPMLRKFYAVHDGFGDIIGASLLNSTEIGVLQPRPAKDRDSIGSGAYMFKDMLVVIDYGSDYEDCIIRRGNNTDSVAEWDENVWQINPKNTTFLAYINELFARVDEE